MLFTPDIFYLAAFLYVLSWVAALSGRQRVCLLFFVAGLGANLLSAICRYSNTWPLLPMFQGPFFLPLCIGILSLGTVFKKKAESIYLFSLICFLALIAVFFPGDFYLPFLQSATVFSHAFFLLGMIAKACFFIASIHGGLQLWIKYRSAKVSKKPDSTKDSALTTRWIVWGFASWTLSMFCGEIWSYLGWGSPVIWDDASIMITMAMWFYYAFFLHLHLFRTWSPETRYYFAILGAILVLIFNFYSEMGKFQRLDFQWL